MAAKRTNGAAKTPHAEPARPQPTHLFKEVVDAQMNLWKKWARKAGTDTSVAAKEVAPIVAQYWSKMFAALWESAIQARTGDSPLAGQDELRRYMLLSYNDMMKRVLATKSFAARSGNSVKGLLEGVKAWNEVMEETLRALHLPSRGDIDELHEALFNLNKRVDYLTRTLEKDGNRAIELTNSLSQKARQSSPTLDCEIADVQTWAHLSLYFAEKLRAGVALETFRKTKVAEKREQAVSLLKKAAQHWADIAAVTDAHYRAVPAVQLSGSGRTREALFSWRQYQNQADRDIQTAASAE